MFERREQRHRCHLIRSEIKHKPQKHAGRGGFDGSVAEKFDALIAATALAVGASVASAMWAGSSVAG